jgi:formimidoylglutamate deiminase
VPILVPDLVWREDAFRSDLAVDIDPWTGRIRAVLQAPAIAPGAAVQRLGGRALLPGFVNAHSHSFQRLLRGRAQWRPAEGNADFWSWREAMYGIANALSPDDVYHVARFCFIEMLLAGWTSVGEFHYLHNDPEGRRYEAPFELATRVIAAAEDAGIRIRLLNVAYATGGIGQPLLPEQRRFATPRLESFLQGTMELVEANASRPLVSIGVAPHSIRAVPRGWLRPMHALAFGYDLPFHIHANEQPAEIAACMSAYGKRPVEVMTEEGVVDGLFTAVHATHVTHNEISLLASNGPSVCACPTTERDLGDGFLPGDELRTAGARIAMGTDGQSMIDPFAEMRLLEYHERLRKLRRVVLARSDTHGRLANAPLLIEAGTVAGAASLRLDAGVIAPGAFADLVAIDLQHLALAGADAERLAAMVALCAPRDVVCDVWVGGVQRISDRRHVHQHAASAAFRRVAAAVDSAADEGRNGMFS